MKKLLLGVICLSTAFAIASDWSPTTKLGEINAGYVDDKIIFSAAHMYNPANCATHHYEVNSTDANVGFSLLMLLAAQARDAPVRIAVHPTKCGVSNYPLVTRIKLIK